MRVSDSRRVLFVHVPKTGGSSIDRIFDTEVADSRRVADRARHATYRRLLSAEPQLADYWSFGFVRNPWARLVSWWTMVGRVFEQAEAGHVPSQEKIRKYPGAWLPEGAYRHDFAAFVLEATAEIPRVGRPQLRTLSADGRGVDFIGRLETFDRDVAVVREHLGLAPVEAVPHLNKSPHAHYREYYDDRTREHVARVFAVDIEEFGYEF
jgi:hypothetical protein